MVNKRRPDRLRDCAVARRITGRPIYRERSADHTVRLPGYQRAAGLELRIEWLGCRPRVRRQPRIPSRVMVRFKRLSRFER